MIQSDKPVNIRTVKPDSGKSAIVIARTSRGAAIIEFDTFLDQKMIGVTKGRGFFVKKDIEPGVHYLIARAENHETGKIKFEPDTVYYIQQSPRIGWWKARISLTPKYPTELEADMDSECRYMEYDQKYPGEDLTKEEYNMAVQDYEKEITEGYHADFTEYKGSKVR